MVEEERGYWSKSSVNKERNSLGVLCRKKGDYSTALKHYERALKIHPKEANIWPHSSRDMKNPEKAESYFRTALRLDSGFKDARQVLHGIDLGFTSEL